MPHTPNTKKSCLLAQSIVRKSPKRLAPYYGAPIRHESCQTTHVSAPREYFGAGTAGTAGCSRGALLRADRRQHEPRPNRDDSENSRQIPSHEIPPDREITTSLNGLDHGIGHLACMSPQKNERLTFSKG